MSKHSHAVASLRRVVADGTQLASTVAHRAELESRTPVRYSLTPPAEATLTGSGEDPGPHGPEQLPLTRPAPGANDASTPTIPRHLISSNEGATGNA